MEGKLQELTQKIYQDGVLKAKSEASTIVDQAKGEADRIISNAKKEADRLISQAKEEAEQLKNKVLSELKMSGSQAVTTLKQQIETLLADSVIKVPAKAGLSDENFLKDILKELISKWDSNAKSLDLNIILPEKSKEKLTDFFKNKASEILSKGIELKFESRMENGFKIGPKDNSFVLSFTDKEVNQFFQSFLKQKTKEILFPGA